MGKNWRRRDKNKHRKQGDGDDDNQKNQKNGKDGGENNPYRMVEHGNYRMESFYAYQGIYNYSLEKETDDDGNVLSYKFVDCATAELKDQERHRWKEAMKGTLPASFRIGGDVDVHLRERLEHELEEMVGKKMEIEIVERGGELRSDPDAKPEIKRIAPAQKIPFIPHAYQLSLDRQTIRRNSKLEPFHNWLKVQTEAGFITRQETVSMIPPVVLNPEPHHKILDMAAAPGSKTSQLLECVNVPSKTGDHEPTGFVVANDNDPKRAYMLTHQIRRINSPAIFITSCDARHFPILKDSEGTSENFSEGIFDRVLADVPCSGDGTSRKNPGIWKNWTSMDAYSLHPIQLAIALRGAQCTKVGGYLCYSTCSMNPIENEAVVAALLRASEGSLQLVERRSELPGMVARPGMTTWRNLVPDKSNLEIKNKGKKNNAKMQARRKEFEKEKIAGDSETSDPAPARSPANGTEKSTDSQENESFVTLRTKFNPISLDDMEELKKMVEAAGMVEYTTFEEVPNKMRKKVLPTCFPPSPEELSKFHLDRCMRIMPQDMNTGGFFVTLLKKVAPLNARARKKFMAMQAQLDDEGDELEPNPKKAKLVDNNAALSTDDQEKDIDLPEKELVRGHLKRDFLVQEDGTKSKTIGNDDLIPVSEELFAPVKEYYGIDEESFKEGQFATRAIGDKKVLYFLTKSIKKNLIDARFQEKVTVIASGIKAFVRNSKDCEATYRVSQEGIHLVAPHMSKRKLVAGFTDFETCSNSETVEIKDLTADFQAEVRALSVGSFVVCLRGYENDYIKKLVLVMWRCRSDAIKYLVTQAEIDGMRSKLRAVKEMTPLLPSL